MKWDFIIVGAGSAGCALAHQLVTYGSGKVLLVEAGGSDRSLDVRLPFRMLQALDRYDWGYRCEPDDSRKGRSEGWQRGRLVGGTSSVNGMIYVRGSKADFSNWSRLSDESWAPENVLPLFREMEGCDGRSISSPQEARGFSGPLHVRQVMRPHRTTRAYVAAMDAQGYPLNTDYNAVTQEGTGYTQLTQHRGMRFSAFDAFVRPHLKSGRLSLLHDCDVQRILVEGGRATGIACHRGGVAERHHAAKIVVCAGSIATPRLLMLSGIGDAQQLQAHGIPVNCHSPAVGKGLNDHPIVRITYDMRVPTYALGGNPLHQAGIVGKYLLFRQGLLASPHEAMSFVRSRPGLAEPDLQFHFAPIGVEASNGTARLKRTPSAFISIKKNHPASRGEVRLRSADPSALPVIDANLLGDPADVRDLVSGIQILRQAMAGSAMAPLVEGEAAPSAGCESDAELEAYVRGNATIACHHVGTCAMGSDPTSVVDPALAVRGLDGLWIADASVMPTNISGNTNAASMMIGYKLGRELGQS